MFDIKKFNVIFSFIFHSIYIFGQQEEKGYYKISFVYRIFSFIFQTSNVPHKLDFLDGYRGFLALNVIFTHYANYLRLENKENLKFILDADIQACEYVAGKMSVTGFFILSSFLLTYRLTNEFDKHDSTWKIKGLNIIQYTIRRFFRIYLVFVIFWTLVKFGPYEIGGFYWYKHTQSYINGLWLQPMMSAHLWTIPPEIRYYFFIPVISLIGSKMGEYIIPVIIVSNYLLKYNQPSLYNDIYDQNLWFSIFNLGSLVGLIYFNLQKHKKLLDFIHNCSPIQHFIKILLIYSLINPYYLSASYYIHGQRQALFLSFMLLNESGFIKNIFSNSFLRSCGKYSFGMYLFHPRCTQMTLDYFQFEFSALYIIVAITFSYYVGFVWFYFIENMLMRLANFLCAKLA